MRETEREREADRQRERGNKRKRERETKGRNTNSPWPYIINTTLQVNATSVYRMPGLDFKSRNDRENDSFIIFIPIKQKYHIILSLRRYL